MSILDVSSLVQQDEEDDAKQGSGVAYHVDKSISQAPALLHNCNDIGASQTFLHSTPISCLEDTMIRLCSFLLAFCLFDHATAFQTPLASLRTAASTQLYLADEAASTDIEAFLNERYPVFMTVLSRNEKACKVLRESASTGFTVFAPNNQAFVDLGETKVAQLADPRNTETAEKIGAYHVINEPVTATALFNAGGVITMGGEVPIDRSSGGGFFGFGGKEDGGVTVNGAKVVETIEVGAGIVHEMDGLVSPNLLWRYLDQLRIPGSN